VVLGRGRLPLDGPPLTLVRTTPRGHQLTLTRAMRGQLRLPHGEEQDLARLTGEALDLPHDSVVDLSIGPYHVQVASEPSPRRLPRRALAGLMQRDDGLSHAGSLVFHGVVLFLALALPPAGMMLSRDDLNRLEAHMPKRWARVLVGSWSPADLGVWGGGGSARRAPGEQGQLGQPTAPRRVHVSGVPRLAHLDRQLAIRAAREVGSVLGGILPDVQALDPHVVQAMATMNVVGAAPPGGLAYGVGGLGLVGRGRGGGGARDSEFIGFGDVGTVGLGLSGSGSGSGYSQGFGGMGSLAGSDVGIIVGRAEVTGALDKEVIRRVIRRHINQWRYCYERELQANPNLWGRVVVRFTIAPTGQVVASEAVESTVGNAAVDRCMAQAVRRWQFPKPKGGGVVVVNYPVVVKSADG